MIATDEDLMICDLAETYGILNHRELPAELLATLCCGLRDSSRIKMKLYGMKVTNDMLLLSAAVDYLAFLVWAKTKDGAKGRNKPKSIVNKLTGNEERESDIMTFDTAEEFEAARKRILGEGDKE